MNRVRVIFAVACTVMVLAGVCAFHSQPLREPDATSSPQVTNNTSPASPHPYRSEIHPHVESFWIVFQQGDAGQICDEMRTVIDYCQERPENLSVVLAGLGNENGIDSSDSEAAQAFGQNLMKGHSKPANQLIEETALAWSKQNQSPRIHELGHGILAQVRMRETNSISLRKP